MVNGKEKVMLAHNFYRSSVPSGENQVFEMEKELLVRNGHSVTEFTRTSDELISKGLLGKLKELYLLHGVRLLQRILRADLTLKRLMCCMCTIPFLCFRLLSFGRYVV